MRLAVFEEVDRATEVVVHELAAARPAVDAGKHARVRGGVDHEVGGGQGVHLRREAQVGGDDLDAEFSQGGAVDLAARADEIVEACDLVTGGVQRPGEGAAGEAADAGNQDAHGARKETDRAGQVKREMTGGPIRG